MYTYTSDPTYYDTDLAHIPPLTRQEEARLVQHLRLAHNQPLASSPYATRARQRLIEGNLRLVYFHALKYRRLSTRSSLDDLIQEGNLPLVQATERCPYRDRTFSGYASQAIEWALKTLWVREQSLSISTGAFYHLYQERKLGETPSLLPVRSLDQPVAHEEQRPLGETIAAPPLLLTSGEEAHAAKTALVNALLARLTPLQERVVRLRFGLGPLDGRERTQVEIAQELGLSEYNVSATLQRALHSCRRLYEDGLRPRSGTRGVPRQDQLRACQERTRRLHEALAALYAQGWPVTTRTLAAQAQVPARAARDFLRTQVAAETRGQDEQQRLEEAYAALQAQGSTITAPGLCKLACATPRATAALLRAKAGNEEERLTAAYAQLQAQGLKTIGRKRLARAAQVGVQRAARYLREQQARATG
jgi:RNA polymerase sporulation-specific sigma factor